MSFRYCFVIQYVTHIFHNTVFIFFSGLSVLQEIDLSSRESKFSEAALNKLLNTNLSAKYALTGTLSYDNIIDDIFYDTGKVVFYFYGNPSRHQAPIKVFILLEKLSLWFFLLLWIDAKVTAQKMKVSIKVPCGFGYIYWRNS